MSNRYVIAFALAALALTACGGGGGSHASGSVPSTGGNSSTVPDLSINSPHNAGAAVGAVTSKVAIQVPLATQTDSTKRRPQYLTSYTLGIDLQDFQNGVYSGYVFYPIGTGQSNCTAAGTTLSCTLAIQAPPGDSQILVHTYDGTAMATSKVLSVAAVPETIVAAQTNNITITTNPIAAHLSTNGNFGLPNCVALGTPATFSLPYTAVDADGGSLAGLTLGNTLTFSDLNTNDTAPGFTMTPSAVSTGSGTLTFNYNGSDTNLYVQAETSSLTPSGTTNVLLNHLQGLMPIQTAGPHYVFFSTPATNRIGVFDMCASNFGASGFITSYALPAGTNPQVVQFDRHSTAADPRAFVLGGPPNNQLLFLDIGASTPGGNAVVLQTLTPGGTLNAIKHASGALTVWLAFGTSSITRYTLNEAGPTYLTPATTNAGFNNPVAMGLGASSQDLFVVNKGAGQILGMNPTTLAIDKTITVGGAPSEMSSANGVDTCSLADDSSNADLYGISPESTGTSTSAQIGSTVPLPGPPVGSAFFPISTTASGLSNTTTTGFVLMPGVAMIVSCTATALSQVAMWTSVQTGVAPGAATYIPSLMSNPASLQASSFASNSIPGLIYVVGLDQGVPVFFAYSQFAAQPVFFLENIGGSSTGPSSVSAGP